MQSMTAKLRSDLMGEGCQFQSTVDCREPVALRTQGRAPGPLLQEQQCKGPEAEALGAGVSDYRPIRTFHLTDKLRQMSMLGKDRAGVTFKLRGTTRVIK